MKRIEMFSIAVLALSFILSCNSNKQNADKNESKNAMLVENAKVKATTDNQSFVEEAVKGGLMEVELGRYAEQNALNPRVKNFGAIMVREHSKVNDELTSIAGSKKIEIPLVMDESHMSRVNELKKRTGADFDREYMKMMVDDHDKDVEKFRSQAENGKDAEITAFATKTLPVLIAHQDSARAILKVVEKQNFK